MLLIGELAAAPTLRFTPAGLPVCELPLKIEDEQALVAFCEGELASRFAAAYERSLGRAPLPTSLLPDDPPPRDRQTPETSIDEGAALCIEGTLRHRPAGGPLRLIASSVRPLGR